MTRQEAEDRILAKVLEIRAIYREYAGDTEYLAISIIDDAINFWNNGYRDEDVPKVDRIYRD